MAALRREAEEEWRNEVPAAGIVDFILARIEANGTSKRRVALQTGISRSRLGKVLHNSAEKRCPIKLDEIAQLLRALGISHMEAKLAAEQFEKSSQCKAEAVTNVASMLTAVFEGLPEQLADIIAHIDGLEFDDIRREHGKRVRALVVKVLTDEYTDMAQRREFRIAALRD